MEVENFFWTSIQIKCLKVYPYAFGIKHHYSVVTIPLIYENILELQLRIYKSLSGISLRCTRADSKQGTMFSITFVRTCMCLVLHLCVAKVSVI